LTKQIKGKVERFIRGFGFVVFHKQGHFGEPAPVEMGGQVVRPIWEPDPQSGQLRLPTL
jgi:hypothetical protein